MLGEKISESSGKVTGQRVLSNPGGGPKMETSFQSNGTLLGVEASETGTYWSVLRPDGTLYGEGQGILMSREGDVATWVGQGVGRPRRDGGFSYRGAVYYESASPKWSRLAAVASLFEYEVDADGNTRAENWEWK